MKIFAHAVLLGVAALAPLIAAAGAGEITLYTRDHFGGPALSLHEAAPDLDQLGFNDRTSSVVVRSGSWEVCESVQYKGKCMVLEPGEYPLLKNFNDMMSSVREVPKKEPDGKPAQRPVRATAADKK